MYFCALRDGRGENLYDLTISTALGRGLKQGKSGAWAEPL